MNQDLDYNEKLNESKNEENSEKGKTSKEERIEKNRQDVLNRVLSGKIENLRDKVAYILNHSNEARNSDIELLWIYWETFEKEKLSGSLVSKDQMKELARISSLCRIRAKIQNEYKLFQATDSVKRFRGTLEEEKRTEAIEDKPTGIGMYSVYIDETGKNQDYLSVGSLWILSIKLNTAFKFNRELIKWKKENKIDFEFHFKELTKNKLQFYKDFFVKFITAHPETGFKLIVVNNKGFGFSDKAKAITDLTYHLIRKGIDHENTTGRAPLPRVLQVCLDEDEKGSDQLKIENIKERIISQNIKGLYLDTFEAVSSADNYYIQIVDLFTASINRKLHSASGNHFKDEFADFVLGVLNFDISNINLQNTDIDNSILFNLSEFTSINK